MFPVFRRNILAVLFLAFVCLPVSGCFYVILGSVAAAGGYAISQDTIQGEREVGFNEVWDAALDIVSIMGTVNSQSQDLGKITAVVNGAKLTINVAQITPSAVRLKIKARKNFFPSIATAQNIFIKIMNRVDE